MLITAKTVDEIARRHARMVGFYGAPPKDILFETAERHGTALVDLDVDYGAPETGVVPKAFCHIIRNCVDNAIALRGRLVAVVAATGKEKCDAGRYAAWLIREHLDIEVHLTENHALPPPSPPLLSEMRGPVTDRAVRIMQAIVNPLDDEERRIALAGACPPTHGFWGTPPHPIGLLDLFPDTTHLFGWTRCVEQGRPADIALEMTVPDDLPIVFFSQGFCQKSALAKHLAEKHNGIHVDVHDAMNAAITAKIEAFIRLTGGGL
jgi:hypothetical protein